VTERLNQRMGDTKIAAALLSFEKLVRGDSAVEDLGPRTAEIRGAVKTAGREYQDAIENESAALYVALNKDNQLDLLSKGFADALFNACGRRRDDPRFKAAMPRGAADVSQPRLWEQETKINSYIPEWTKLADRDTVVAEWLPKIREGATNLTSALAALKTATDGRNTARWNQLRARMSAIAIWDSNHGEVIRRFPGDRARVESYFPTISAGTVEAEEETPAAPPTGTTPPTP